MQGLFEMVTMPVRPGPVQDITMTFSPRSACYFGHQGIDSLVSSIETVINANRIEAIAEVT
jgi:hypothetical protein